MFLRKDLCSYIVCIILHLFAFNSAQCDASELVNKDNAVQQLYFYIPVSFCPNSTAIEHCLSKSVYKAAGVHLLQTGINYHVSMGDFLMPSKESANEVSFRIQKLVRTKFSHFTAEIDQKEGGISIFGNFVVIVLKTDKSKNNKQRNLFHSIHRTIKKMVLAAGGTQTGFLEFKPHCSVASITQITNPVFQKIQKKLIKDLTETVSKSHLSVNPRVLQYRISVQRQED